MWLLITSSCVGLLAIIVGVFIFKISSVLLLGFWIFAFFSPSLVVLGKLYDKVIGMEKDNT